MPAREISWAFATVACVAGAVLLAPNRGIAQEAGLEPADWPFARTGAASVQQATALPDGIGGADGGSGDGAEGPSVAPAGDGLDDLRARLDALERQNEDLMRRLEAGGGSPGAGGSEEGDAVESGDAGTGGVGADGSGTEDSGSDGGADETQGEGETEGDGWYEVGSDVEMTASWHNGFEVISKNKDFRVHVGGRIQMDGVFYDGDEAFEGAGGAGDADAVFFRRARLRVDGTMYEWIDWATEFDFVNSSNFNQGFEASSEGNVINVPAPTDLWVNFKGVPYVGNVRVGNMKEPIGMEHLTSSRFLPFMERSFNQDVFYGPFNNGFTPGAMIWDTYADQRGVWATGVFKDLDNPFAYHVGDGDYAWTSRLTYLPWYDECSEGRNLFHVGLSNSLRDPANEDQRYRARGSLRNGPGPFNATLADTGRFVADTVDYVGAEAAWNYGPLNVQAEYTGGFVSDAIAVGGPAAGERIGSEFVQGGYVQALYFLTGEHMHYERNAGVFGRVEPIENAYVLKGLRGNIFAKGAWQVGVRYSRIDLDSSAALEGGVLDDWTFGLNWYLNPNMKVQSNYVLTDRDAPAGRGEDGLIHGFGMRLAYDF